MASLLARRALSVGRLATPIRTRGLHASSIVQKKAKGSKQKQVVEFDDDFYNDLPSSTAVEEAIPTQKLASIAQKLVKQTPDNAPKPTSGLGPEERLEKFDALFQFVSERLGRRPVVRTPEISSPAWVHLLDLAPTREHLERVVELMPQWRDTHYRPNKHLRTFREQDAMRLAVRVGHLGCPDVALKVFGDYAKYTLPLTLRVARELLLSLSKGSVEDVFAATALYPIYSLPPVSTDPLSCAILYRHCLRHETPETQAVAQGLLPALQKGLNAMDFSSPYAPNELHLLSAELRRLRKIMKTDTKFVDDWISAYDALDTVYVAKKGKVEPRPRYPPVTAAA